ncbi:zinc-binding dehydrogenase [Herbiconiux sp. VKM Ac-1786]|nr:zinc-binding dehydrogenase [Herbiconiux sp. VKM Ac-1786]MBF4571859.1 zinc-binding dehydrogenase [Herbiconiux sp. VKM Ac-1786]
MTGVVFREFGGPEVLKPESMPVPEPGPGDVLVRVGAVSVGRLLDIVARSGKHPYATFQFPHVLGAEHAGTVAAVGPGVDGVSVGDRVAVFPVVVPADDEMVLAGFGELASSVAIIGTHRQGAYAQYSRVPAANLLPVTADIDPVEAVSVALAGGVAMNQFDRAGGVGPGTRVIVQGATSALGSTTALLAKHLGADVIVTSRHESKRERLRELGFTHVLDAIDGDFPDRVREAFGGKGAQVIVDNLGAPLIWEHGFEVLAPGGTVVSSGAFLGHQVPINLQRLYSLGQRVVGVRSSNLNSAKKAWGEVSAGFRSVVDRTFSLTDAAAAHQYVESGGNVGRVALTVD